MSVVMRCLLIAVLGLVAPVLCAHELSMAEMEVREIAPGDFLWQWTASGNKPASEQLAPSWPATCTAEESVLHCGPAGLDGEIRVAGVGETYSAAIVRIYWLDGRNRVFTLTAGQPSARLFGGAEDDRGGWQIASVYTGLGFEHILGGVDHLLFVVGLLFLVGLRRRLIVTITAFTLAHSLTLALSALGWLTLRSPPVEATIALSIMLVAGEALNRKETLSRRWPPLVAFLFGLVHGLGFAGALTDIGLPHEHLLVALLTFNLGVEAGQLCVVALAFAGYRLLAGQGWLNQARVPALYGIGGVAGFWTIGRIAALFA